MEILWGILMIMVGLFMLISGLVKSNFIIYRILIARSKMLWGEIEQIIRDLTDKGFLILTEDYKNVHRFYQIIGTIVIVFGILMAIGIIGK